MRVFHFVVKKEKRRGPWDRIPFFLFQWFWFFFFSILIQIITYLTTHYSQNVFRGFSILVYIGVQVFFRGFFFRSSSRTRLALALASHLPPFHRKTLKIAPVLQNQASLMKLRVHGFLFLVFLHIKTDGKNRLFL